MKHRTLSIAGTRVDIAWNETEDKVEATVNGRKYTVEKKRLSTDAFWFGVEGTSIEVSATPSDGGYDVFVRGKQFSVEFIDAQRRARRQGASGDGTAAVRAPMPGKIVRILAEPGAQVEAHQGIVVMEAMKMQNEIRSPKRGKVLQLKVVEGDAVKLGDLIAEIG